MSDRVRALSWRLIRVAEFSVLLAGTYVAAAVALHSLQAVL